MRTVGRGVTLGLGVRVLRGDATGYAYTEELSDERMLEAARTAAQIASSGGAPAPVAITPDRAARTSTPIPRSSLDHPGADKVDAAPPRRRGRARRRPAHRARRGVAGRGVARGAGRHLGRPPGARSPADDPLRRQRRRRGGRAAAGRALGRRGALRHGVLRAARARAPRRTAARRRAWRSACCTPWRRPRDRWRSCSAPGESGILLHEAVGHGLEADFNRKKTSNYTDQVGKPVASALCTVVDDGTIGERARLDQRRRRGQPGPAQRAHRGRHPRRLHAGPASRPSTSAPTPSGNGRRQSFRHEPLPRMTNTFMAPGQDDPEDIIRSVKRGVYAKHFSGGQVNISNGDFVFALTESYLIEDGKLTAPLKGVNLIGNGPDVLRKVTMLGNDFALSDGTWTCGKDGQSVPVGIGTPTMKIAEITVGGTRTAMSAATPTGRSRRPGAPASAARSEGVPAPGRADAGAREGRRRRRRRGAGARRHRAGGQDPPRRARAGQGGRAAARSACACSRTTAPR